MLVHNVFFWLPKRLDGDQITEFRMGLESLKSIEHAHDVFIGTPADVAERPVVDTSYDFALVVLFKDVAAHNAYQAHPTHQAFLEAHIKKCRKVRVYDVD